MKSWHVVQSWFGKGPLRKAEKKRSKKEERKKEPPKLKRGERFCPNLVFRYDVGKLVKYDYHRQQDLYGQPLAKKLNDLFETVSVLYLSTETEEGKMFVGIDILLFYSHLAVSKKNFEEDVEAVAGDIKKIIDKHLKTCPGNYNFVEVERNEVTFSEYIEIRAPHLQVVEYESLKGK